MLHPGLDVAGWMLVASGKGWQPNKQCVDFILAMAYELAAVELQDPVQRMPSVSATEILPDLSLCFEKGLSPRESSLVRAIAIRAAYGGMPGDVSMLRTAAHVWLNRFSREAEQRRTQVSPRARWLEDLAELYDRAKSPTLDLDELYDRAKSPTNAPTTQGLAHLSNGDCPRAAIDFHVSNVLRELRSDRELESAMIRACPAGESLDSAMQSAMWLFRSSLNKKEKMPVDDARKEEVGRSEREAEKRKESLQLLWNAMEARVEAYANQRIRRAYS